jgi:biotin carboxyl carrier protein
LPDSVGSRLDQGIDATGKTFLSPWAGTVVRANAKDSGWRGGGYIAVQSTDDPSKVAYFAEGITPIVKLGQIVTAGQRIGLPVSNPYNGIVGNIEFGPANPSSPGQPLAQVSNNARQMVLDFYGWLESVGGPKATSTSNAGAA